MAVYAITGELGTGKTLLCVSKIRDALVAGRRVATNLDLKLELLVPRGVECRVDRVPDRPTRASLEALGNGFDGAYDESKFGLLVLDEAALFLNSREYQDKDRHGLIRWLTHARHFLWDVLLIIQDLSMLDKQVRTGFVEHVVTCRRTDRFTIPFLSSFLSVFSGSKVTLPKAHLAVVRYGIGAYSPIVERWWYSGKGLYGAYSTVQNVFEGAACSYLCPTRYAYLRAPVGRSEAVWRLFVKLCTGGSVARWWAAHVLQQVRPSQEWLRYNDFRLAEMKLYPTPYKPPLTFDEWAYLEAGYAIERAKDSKTGALDPEQAFSYNSGEYPPLAA